MDRRRRRQHVTMADVAAAAGVSITTVSHVVNRSRVVGATLERNVLEAIASTGYVTEQVARTAASAPTRIIGLAMSAMTNPYFGEVVHAIDRSASERDYSLLLGETHDDPATELRAVGDLLRRRVDALILAPSADASGALKLVQERDVPVVIVDRFVSHPIDQVGTENQHATARLVTHLTSKGHERIGLISGLTGLATTEERLAGFREGMNEADLEVHPELVVSGNSDDAGAEAAVAQFLALSNPPTAMIVTNNRMTIGALRALRDAGIEVPKDMALVGFDDFVWADLFHPRLTVVAQPIDAIGSQALELALRRLEDPDSPAKQIRIQPTFVHRNSCGCVDP